jgi:hypothetical protein
MRKILSWFKISSNDYEFWNKKQKPYGYWILGDGSIHEVGYMGHEEAVKKLGYQGYYGILAAGGIRVVTCNWPQVDVGYTSPSSAAMKTLESLIITDVLEEPDGQVTADDYSGKGENVFITNKLDLRKWKSGISWLV